MRNHPHANKLFVLRLTWTLPEQVFIYGRVNNAFTTYHVTRTWVTTLHEWTNLDRRIVANSQSPPSKCCWYSNLRKKFERTMASVTVRSKNFLPPRLAVEKVWFSRNLSETGYEQTANHRRQNVVDIATCVKNLKGQWRRLRSVVRIFCLPGWRSKRFDFRVILARQATKSLNLVEICKAVVWSRCFRLI